MNYFNIKRFSQRWTCFCITASVAIVHTVASVEITKDNYEQPEVSSNTDILLGDSVHKKASLLQGSISFDPAKYQLQNRYLEKGDSFRNRFRDHFSLGFVTGVNWVYPKGESEVKPYIPIGITLGYDFSRLHTLRLTGTFSTFEFLNSNGSVEQWGVDFDYIFNLSAYLNGYNKRRIVSVSPTLGLGYIYSNRKLRGDNIFKGQVGLNLSVSLGRNAKFFAEPFCAFTSDKIDYSGNTNLSGYDILYGVRAGVAINLDNSNDFYDSEVVYTKGFFYELSQGLSFATSGDIGFFRSLGTGYRVSIGRWFDPIIGVRTSAGGSEFYWSRDVTNTTIVTPAYERQYKERLFFGRVEGLINPLNFSSFWRQMRHPFELNIAVGGEFGWLMKRIPNTPQGLKCNYAGFAGAISCLYNIDKETSIFIEPRILVANFKEPYINIDRKASFIETSMSVYAGIRVCAANRKERASWPPYIFEKRLFSGIQVGGLKHMQAAKQVGDFFPNFSGTFYVGYHLARMVTLKSAIEYMMLSQNEQTPYIIDFMGSTRQFNALYQHRYGMLNFKLSYMLNLSNIYQKYDLNRKFHVYAEAGAMWAMCRRQTINLYSKEFEVPENAQVLADKMKNKGVPAAFLGVAVQYKMNKNWSLIVEPEAQYYLQKNFFGGTTAERLNDFIVKFNVGTSYTF